MEELVNGLDDENEGEDDHGDSSDPGDEVEEETVGVFTHEIFAVDEEKNEDDDDGKPNAIADLREDEDFPERGVGDKNDAAADKNENGIEPVEGWGFAELVVETGFEAEAFADDMRGGERKDGGSEEGGVEKAEGEGKASPLASERDEGFGSLTGVGDIGEAVAVQGRCGADDDEEDDDHAGDGAEKDVEAGLGILTGANLFLDETRLQVKELPRCDGGADESSERDEISCVEMDAGDDGHACCENPVGLGQNSRE